jgi:hypothetical protein
VEPGRRLARLPPHDRQKAPDERQRLGNGYIRAHHRWWFERLPKAPGRGPDGKLANWWGYVVDFNRYKESAGAAGA